MSSNKYLDALIHNAIEEDIGDGDHTSLACIPASKQGKAELLVKQKGILAGVEIVKYVLHRIDRHLRMESYISDGAIIDPGDKPFSIEGSVISFLHAERLVLNILQRMSGIATQTNEYVNRLHGLKTKVLDTRKTTPGMRILEKEAVRIGGGVNHRMGLFDMILIKDNHIDFAGGIEQAIHSTKDYLKRKGKDLKIEVETRSIEDVKTVLEVGGVDRILLDNFTIENTRQAVELINKRIETESSGGITLENIRDYAECGVDYISIGALTHQIKSLDMSLKAVTF